MWSQKDINKSGQISGQIKNQTSDNYRSPEVRKNYLQIDQNTLHLSDLSPFFPLSVCYQTASTQFRVSANSDMIFIETPANNLVRPSYMEQVDEGMKSISKIISWANDQESSRNLEDVEQYQSSLFQMEKNQLKIMPSLKSIDQQKTMELQNKIFVIKQNEGKNDKNNLNKDEKNINAGKRTCNCKKTQCLKLYCDCFRDGLTCDGCSCVGCHNTPQNKIEREQAMKVLIDKNPEAFKPKIQSAVHTKGCNCKKSYCQKKYCECYQAGLKCGKSCKCEDCKNCQHQIVQKNTSRGIKNSNSFYSNKKVIVGSPSKYLSKIKNWKQLK